MPALFDVRRWVDDEISRMAAEGKIVMVDGKWRIAGPMGDPRWPFEHLPHG